MITPGGFKPRKPICNLPINRGSCQAKLRRFYFDSTDETCKLFVFGGCQGGTYACRYSIYTPLFIIIIYCIRRKMHFCKKAKLFPHAKNLLPDLLANLQRLHAATKKCYCCYQLSTSPISIFPRQATRTTSRRWRSAW